MKRRTDACIEEQMNIHFNNKKKLCPCEVCKAKREKNVRN